MAKSSPSYLYRRGHIYYFQLRLPREIAHSKHGGKLFVRKSTGTGNRREALKIARQWWIQVMAGDDDTLKMAGYDGKFIKDLSAYEEVEEKREALYSRGKYLYGIMQTVDPYDGKAIDEVMLEYFHGAFDMEAFNYYQDHITGLKEREENKIVAQPVVRQTTVQVSYPDKRLGDLVAEYVADKMNGARPWSLKTKDKFEMHLRLLVEMLGDPCAQDMDVSMVTTGYAHRIKKIPKGINNSKALFFKNGKRLGIEEVFQIAEKRKCPTISDSTVWDYVSTVRTFLSWAGKRKYLERDLDVALEEFKKPKDKIEVLPFTNDELQRIFYSDYFRYGKEMRFKPERYWVPLISLYSGARIGEIAQLYVSNISQDPDHNIWVMAIQNEGEGQRLKTANAKRLVPVHKGLIALGFIEFYKQQKQKGAKQLFTNLSPNSTGHWGGAVGSWFRRHLVNQGIITDEGTRKAFHSFRHTVINYEKQNGLDEYVMSEIVGHAYDRNKVHSGYQKQFDLPRKHKELNKINYGLDLSRIRKWQG